MTCTPHIQPLQEDEGCTTPRNVYYAVVPEEDGQAGREGRERAGRQGRGVAGWDRWRAGSSLSGGRVRWLEGWGGGQGGMAGRVVRAE